MAHQQPSTEQNKKPRKRCHPQVRLILHTSTKESTANMVTQIENPGNLNSDLTPTPTKDQDFNKRNAAATITTAST